MGATIRTYLGVALTVNGVLDLSDQKFGTSAIEFTTTGGGSVNRNTVQCSIAATTLLWTRSTLGESPQFVMVTPDQPGELWVCGAASDGSNPTWNLVGVLAAGCPFMFTPTAMRTNASAALHSADTGGGYPAGATDSGEVDGVLYSMAFRPSSTVTATAKVKTVVVT